MCLSGVWFPARGPRTLHVRTTPDNPSPATAIHIAKLHNIMFACLCSILIKCDLELAAYPNGGPIPGVRNTKPMERGRLTTCAPGSHGADDLNHKSAFGLHACDFQGLPLAMFKAMFVAMFEAMIELWQRPSQRVRNETERACSNSDTRCSNSCEGAERGGREKGKGGERGGSPRAPKQYNPYMIQLNT